MDLTFQVPFGALSTAERSYPRSKVRARGLECQAVMAQEWPTGATWHPRSGAAAGRSYPASEVGAARRSHLASEAWGGDSEEPP